MSTFYLTYIRHYFREVYLLQLQHVPMLPQKRPWPLQLYWQDKYEAQRHRGDQSHIDGNIFRRNSDHKVTLLYALGIRIE